MDEKHEKHKEEIETNDEKEEEIETKEEKEEEKDENEKGEEKRGVRVPLLYFIEKLSNIQCFQLYFIIPTGMKEPYPAPKSQIVKS